MARPEKPRLLAVFHSFGQSYMHVPALLQRTGCPVDAVFSQGHPLRRAKGFEQSFVVPIDGWVPAIEDLLASGRYTLLMNVDETGVYSLYDHEWTAPVEDCLPFSPSSPLARTVGNKAAFHEWCLAHSLPVPETHAVEDFESALAFSRTRSGPWLLKGNRGFGGQRVLAPPFDPPAPEAQAGVWLVQRDHGRRVGSGLFASLQGRLAAWMGIQKNVCLRNGFGPTVTGESYSPPAVGELCAAVAAAGGISGITGFDFVLTDDERPLIIDSHLGRMSPLQHFDRACGVDLGAALGAALRNEQQPVPKPSTGREFIKFPECLQLAFEGRIARTTPGRSVYMPLFPENDLPLGVTSTVHLVMSEVRVWLGAVRRRIFRPPTPRPL
ncbi:MAG: hypothetical protein SFU53_07010 [Terrimicrobiaceae bacterium]|nr:hypothetical protein [Terrimicrobiaceae bacterium]